MKSLRIPEHKINNAYLLIGEEIEVLMEAVLYFAGSIFMRGKEAEERALISSKIKNGSHPDILRIVPDKPEENPHTISVDQIRSRISDTADVRPYEAPYKLYLVEEAEKMNVQAQNALLKTLEEPPEYVIIFLIARNADSLLPTIMSRVMEIRAAERNPRESFTDYFSAEWAKETIRLLTQARFCSIGDILEYIKRRNDERLDSRQLYSFIEIILRDVLCYKSTHNEELLYARELEKEISAMSRELSYELLGELSEELSGAIRGLSTNVNRDLQLENFFMLIKEA